MPAKPTPPHSPAAPLLEKEAAYWLSHGQEIAAKYRNAPGLTAMIGRMRARQAMRFYGKCLAMLETEKLWL